MTLNPLRARLAAESPVLNGWLTTGNALVAEAVAHMGFDCVTLDMQHGAVDWGEALGVLQALGAAGAVPLVRVPWNDPAAVMKALDLGAWGVICPMIASADDAASFVRACRYPPAGIRSHGPTRARYAWGPGYVDAADAEVLAIAMIETAGALHDLDAIVATPGIDAVFVGPADLGRALGAGPSASVRDGRLGDAVAAVAERCRASSLPAGVFTRSIEDARYLVELGYRLVTVGGDLDLMAAGARRVVEALRPPATLPT